MQLPLDLLLKITDMAAGMEDPTRAFVEVQNHGACKNVRRDDFNAEYAHLMSSGFLRNLQRRQAREQDFFNRLRDATQQTSPTEDVVMKCANMLLAACNNHEAVVPFLKIMEPYMDEVVAVDLHIRYFDLWPSTLAEIDGN